MARKKKTEEGHNSNAAIKSYVERFERLGEQKEALSEDFKTLGQQVKSEGFDLSIIKELIKIRKNEAAAKERNALLATYAAAIQMDLFPSENLREAS